MYLIINKWVIAVKVSNCSGQYLRNHWTLDIGVLGYIGIVWPKEHSPEFWSVPPVTLCIYICRSTTKGWFVSYHEKITQTHQSDKSNRMAGNCLKEKLLQNTESNTHFVTGTILVFQALLLSATLYIWTGKACLSNVDKVADIGCCFSWCHSITIGEINYTLLRRGAVF